MIEENISGLLVSPNNSKELEQKIIFLLRSDELRRSLGKNAVKRIEEYFDTSVVVKDTINLYEKAIHGAK